VCVELINQERADIALFIIDVCVQPCLCNNYNMSIKAKFIRHLQKRGLATGTANYSDPNWGNCANCGLMRIALGYPCRRCGYIN